MVKAKERPKAKMKRKKSKAKLRRLPRQLDREDSSDGPANDLTVTSCHDTDSEVLSSVRFNPDRPIHDYHIY